MPNKNDKNAKKEVLVKVKRQSAPKQSAHWEEFRLQWRPYMNVIICLRDISENPVTSDGRATTPVSYDSNCLEEVCGSCAMLINGKARMACSALVDQLDQPIRIEPLTKFPVVRDLSVDRQFMFESLKRVKAWIPIDGTYDLGEGPRVAPEIQEKGYPLSRCITCGNCLEVCPQVNAHNPFMGAAIFSQVRLFNMHPTGKMHAKERIAAVMGNGGIEDCANAQNCVVACPKGIPLTESLAEINREAWKQSLFGWLAG
ncbi:MAG TPA: succinate dehydrogenase iron-sulfur subunit [Candidatus Acidoferrum sp.]|jgi:succinate dehydrogenase / fumarate reductase iron-sulfur subunit|nr:succinate dehydrogenase iron-sulfur subunit [Candidatus Acidoferrum sp.]